MVRAARAVLAGVAAAAGGAALVLLWSGDAVAEELAPASTGAAVATYNGQPIESMRSTLEAPLDAAAPAAVVAAEPAAAAFAATSSGATDGPTYNGQPLEQVRHLIEAPGSAPGPVAAGAADGPTYNGQPLHQVRHLIEAPAPAAAPPVGVDGGRHVLYSVSEQRVWLVEDDGTVSRTYLVSGKAGVPRPGTYRVYSKSAWTRSYSGTVRMRWMTRFARGSRGGAIGFHEIPIDRHGRFIQSFSQLGTHRSAGCVRQHPDDALHLWHWAPVGTKVIVKA